MIYTIFGALTLYRDNFMSPEAQKHYATMSLLPRISWKYWVAAFLVIFVGAILEGTYRTHKRQIADRSSESPATVPKEAPRRLKMIFKDSPLFSSPAKERIEKLFNEFYDYLAGTGFDFPNEVPPLGTSPGGNWGWVSPGTRYDVALAVPEDDLDDPDGVLWSFSHWLFQQLFPPQRDDHYNTLAVWTFSDCYRWSFLGKRDKRSRNDVLMRTLWSFRQKLGKEFMDQAMFYTVKRWGECNDKNLTFDEFFARRFWWGAGVIDNSWIQMGYITQVLADTGLYRHQSIKPQ